MEDFIGKKKEVIEALCTGKKQISMCTKFEQFKKDTIEMLGLLGCVPTTCKGATKQIVFFSRPQYGQVGYQIIGLSKRCEMAGNVYWNVEYPIYLT